MRLTRRFVRMLPVFVAAVFLLSCLATAAHLAMAATDGCPPSHPSVRSCGQTLSLDMAPALPAIWASVDSPLVWTAWPSVPAVLGHDLQDQSRPSVPRSPPALPA